MNDHPDVVLTVGGTVKTLTRLTSSREGNPRWRFLFEDGRSANTRTNDAVGYVISTSWEGQRVHLGLNKRGTVVDARLA